MKTQSRILSLILVVTILAGYVFWSDRNRDSATDQTVAERMTTHDLSTDKTQQHDEATAVAAIDLSAPQPSEVTQVQLSPEEVESLYKTETDENLQTKITQFEKQIVDKNYVQRANTGAMGLVEREEFRVILLHLSVLHGVVLSRSLDQIQREVVNL